MANGISNGIGGFSNYYSGKWVPEYFHETKSLAGSFRLGVYATAGSFGISIIFVFSKLLIDWKAKQIDNVNKF